MIWWIVSEGVVQKVTADRGVLAETDADMCRGNLKKLDKWA